MIKIKEEETPKLRENFQHLKESLLKKQKSKIKLFNSYWKT